MFVDFDVIISGAGVIKWNRAGNGVVLVKTGAEQTHDLELCQFWYQTNRRLDTAVQTGDDNGIADIGADVPGQLITQHDTGETALGAASHTGQHEIVDFLMSHGARPDLFTYAMMGNLEAVRAIVGANPCIQAHGGPHGITLRRHAVLGGERAQQVLAYLDEVGGADEGATNLPLQLDRVAFVGSYPLADGSADGFEVSVSHYELLQIARKGGDARTLFHQGDHEFHPAGAPSVKIRFVVNDEQVVAVEIHNPDLVVRARRS